MCYRHNHARSQDPYSPNPPLLRGRKAGTMTTTTTDRTEDPMGFEEPEDYVLRQQLGLRPVRYSQDTATHGHPDQRPCPSWCWVAQDDTEGHFIEPAHPFEAVHTLPATPSVAASLYGAGRNADLASVSTIEPRLEQVGQAPPVINVALRLWRGKEMDYTDELLRLSIDDAEDLIAALSYLVKVAEQ